MSKYLSCKQVEALLKFFTEGNLNPKLEGFVKEHINNCPECKKKYNYLNKNLRELQKEPHIQEQKLKKEFISNLSAYMDNELNSNENIKIKKITVGNQLARRELEKMYNYQKILQASFEKTKNSAKIDFSKEIVAKLANEEYYSTEYFKKICILFVLLIIFIICGFGYLYL